MTGRRVFALALAAILAACLLCVACAVVASAQQCGCPAPVEPPTVPQPLPPMVPGGGYVWLAWVGK